MGAPRPGPQTLTEAAMPYTLQWLRAEYAQGKGAVVFV